MKPVMTKKSWNDFKGLVAGLFAALGVETWIYPSELDTMFQSGAISAGEGRIIAAIFVVGAAIVLFLPSDQ